MKTIIRSLIITSSLIMSHAVWALDPIYTGFFSNQAIKGYDTVAYFTENKPVKGLEDYKTQYNGADWLFSSQQNLDLFLANPEKYAPQYGGYCAYAVSQGSTASIKPELFTIEGGKLYLNYNQSINQKWQANRNEFIQLADDNWPKLLSE